MLVNISVFVISLESPSLECSDSDGGLNVLVYGTASLGGSSQGDWCPSENQVNEAYCNENKTNYETKTMDCPSETPFCGEGVCVSQKVSCEENDGGIDPKNLGTTYPKHIPDHSGNKDYCQSLSTNEPKDSCSGDDCSLREFYCGAGGSFSSFNKDFLCSSGCSNGVCVNYEEIDEGEPELPNTPGTKEYKLLKGWNLVHYELAAKAADASEIKNIYFFLFDPFEKEYFGGASEYFVSNKANLRIEKIIGQYGNNVDDDLYIHTVATWLYLNEDIEIELTGFHEIRHWDDFLDSEASPFNLIKGWNLVPLNPLMQRKFLDDFKGDCNVERMYVFNSFNQKWDNLDFMVRGEGDFDKEDEELGRGLAMKVDNDCKFDFSGSSNVPDAPPTLPD